MAKYLQLEAKIALMLSNIKKAKFLKNTYKMVDVIDLNLKVRNDNKYHFGSNYRCCQN